VSETFVRAESLEVGSRRW